MKMLLKKYSPDPFMWTPFLDSLLPVFMHCTGGMIAVTTAWLENNKAVFKLHEIELSYDE